MSNVISSEINPKSVKEILDMIKAIKAKMPYLNDIDSSSQLLLPKLQEEQVPFVSKCLSHAKNVSAIAPSYIDIDEFEKALNSFNELKAVLHSLKTLTEMVENTIAVSGSDAYVAAVSIFNSVKKQANNNSIPQINSIHFDLTKSFESLGSAKPTHI